MNKRLVFTFFGVILLMGILVVAPAVLNFERDIDVTTKQLETAERLGLTNVSYEVYIKDLSYEVCLFSNNDSFPYNPCTGPRLIGDKTNEEISESGQVYYDYQLKLTLDVEANRSEATNRIILESGNIILKE